MNNKLTESQKGNIVENYIANILLLKSNGQLSVCKPIIDDDGIDFIIYRKGTFKTIFCQVKSRFTVKKNNICQFTVRKNTFKIGPSLIIICVYFSEKSNSIDGIWCIPSTILKYKYENPNDSTFAVTPSIKNDSKDKWSKYRTTQNDLSQVILKLL